MSGVSGSAAVNSGTLASNNPTYVDSLFDYFTTPNIAEVFYNKYGQNTMRLALELMGRMFPVKGNYPFVAHENDNRVKKNIKVHSSDAGPTTTQSSTGSELVFRISADDVDENGNVPVREGQSAWIKQADGTMPELLVTSITKNSTTDVDITVKPFQDVDLDDISTGDVVMLGPINSGENMGQPAGMTSQMVARNFNPFESKDTVYLTSDAMAQEHWFEKQRNGYNSVWNKHFMEAESRMNIAEDMKLIMGEENDNSLTGTDGESNSVSYHSTKGYWQWIDELGGTLDYGLDFSVEYLDEVESFLESWSVTTKNLALFGGSGLKKKIHKAGLDFTQQYDSGTSFVDVAFGGDSEMAVKSNIKAIQYGDIMIAFQPLTAFTDPQMFGNAMSNSGILMPLENIADPSSGDVYNNIGIGYEQKGDISLKRIINEYPGMTRQRGQVSSPYSSDKWFFRSKLLAFLMGANHCLKVTDS
jgi:hypothetical protein